MLEILSSKHRQYSPVTRPQVLFDWIPQTRHGSHWQSLNKTSRQPSSHSLHNIGQIQTPHFLILLLKYVSFQVSGLSALNAENSDIGNIQILYWSKSNNTLM